MRILVGMIVPGRAGGIYVTERALVDELDSKPDVDVDVFEFGSRVEGETIRQRVAGRIRDLVTYDRLLRRDRPDVAYINSAYNKRALVRDVGYALVSRLHQVPLAVKWHGSDAWLVEDKPAPWWAITRLIFRWGAMIPLLSSEEVERFENAGAPRDKLWLAKNVVQLARFERKDVQNFDPPGILFISRFIEVKGLLDVIRAVRIVLDSGRKLQLHCVGDGPIREQAEALVTELDLGHSVVFTGQISEEAATEYYLRCTLMVLPTYHQEGFPMTILQAVAAGLPMITTKIRAAVDYLSEPDHCLWVEPKDPARLAERMIEILDDAELRSSMSENQRALIPDFDVSSVALEYLEMFERAVSQYRDAQ